MGVMPRQRRLKVVGIFQLGLFEFDQAFGYVTLETAGRLAGKIEPDHIELRVRDIYEAPAIADAITRLPDADYLAQDWSDLNRSLFSALWLEKVAISIAIGLIVMVAALNIVASLILLVMEKSRDIAILKTMGASARSIRRIFMLQGLVIGVVGTRVRRRRRRRRGHRARSLPADPHPGRRLPALAPAVHGRAARRRAGGAGGAGHLLRRHHLSVAPGGAARPGGGAAP